MMNIKMRDGKVTMYRRQISKNWQVDVRLPTGGREQSAFNMAIGYAKAAYTTRIAPVTV